MQEKKWANVSTRVEIQRTATKIVNNQDYHNRNEQGFSGFLVDPVQLRKQFLSLRIFPQKLEKQREKKTKKNILYYPGTMGTNVKAF